MLTPTTSARPDISPGPTCLKKANLPSMVFVLMVFSGISGSLGWALDVDILFVRKEFYGTSSRTVQKPFENAPDVRSNLFKLTSDGNLVQLTDLSDLQGGVLDPCVSWDGTHVLFSMRRHRWEGWHIWEMKADGTDLRQATFDPPGQRVNDLDPIYLSETNKFCFVSDRLYGNKEDGTGPPLNLFTGNLESGEVRALGYNPSGEYSPTLDGDGLILMSRYEQSGSNRRGSIWSCRQDGTGMRSRWGQYGSPNGALVAGFDLQWVPGDGNRSFPGIFTDTDNAAGRLGIFTIEEWLRDPEENAALFPQDGKYQSPSLIDPDRILYSFDPDEPEGEHSRMDFGIYIDSIDGNNRTLVYNATETQEIDPVAIIPRTPPPATHGVRDDSAETGVFVCADITLRGDCRQPCSLTPGLGDPSLEDHLALGVSDSIRVFGAVRGRGPGYDVTLGGIDLSQEQGAISILGEIPVAPDGSIALETPPVRAFGFQMLGDDGTALVSEQTWLGVQPGEAVRCAGCHEPKNGLEYTDRNAGREPLALDQPSSLFGSRSWIRTFAQDIQPILQEKCAGCHSGEAPSGGLALTNGSASYRALLEQNFARVPFAYVMEGSARNSFFFQLLQGNAYGQSDNQNRINTINATVDHTQILTAGGRRTVAEWLDTGSAFVFLCRGMSEGPPEVKAVFPQPGASDVPINAVLELVFSEAINPDHRLSDAITVSRSGVPVAGTVEFPREDVLRWVPVSPLEPSTQYTIALATSVTDLEGNELQGEWVSNFETGSGQLTGSPIVEWDGEPDGLQRSPVTGAFQFRFSRPVDVGSLTDRSVEIMGADGERTPFLVEVNPTAERVTVTPFPPLLPSSNYRISFLPQVSDLYGNPLDSTFTLQVTTSASRPPSALTLSADSYNASAYDFDGQDILVSGNGLWTTVLQWNRSKLHWFWNPTRIHHSSLDLAQQPISMAPTHDRSRGYVLTRESAKIQVVDLVNRYVVASSDFPTNQGWEIALSSDEEWAFVGSRDPDRVYLLDTDPSSASYLEVISYATASNHDRGRVWIAVGREGRKVYLTGNRGLDIFDLGGNVLTKTNHLLDGEFLADCEITESGDQLLIINRSRGVIDILDTANERVVAEIPVDFDGEWYWQRADDRIVLSPDNRMIVVTQESTGKIWVVDRATLQVIDRMDLGQGITALTTAPGGDSGWLIHSWVRDRYRDRSRWLTFPGPPGLDGTPPELIRTDPPEGAVDVAVNRTLTLQFSEPMDRHSLSVDTVEVECSDCPLKDVTVSVEIDPDNRTAHVIADGTWPIEADLVVRLATGIRDLSGQPLQEPVSFRFHTAAPSQPPYISLVGDFSEVGNDAKRVAADPTGRWFLTTDSYGDSVYVHDQQTLEFRKRISVGDGPTDIQCPPGTGKAFVCNTRENSVAVLDLNTLEPVTTLGVDGAPVEMAFSPDGSGLYVVCSASDTIVKIDTDSDAVVERIEPPDDAEVQGIATTAARSWFVSGSNQIQVYDTDSVTVYPPPYSSGIRILQFLVSPDGYQIFTHGQYRSAIYITDTDTWRWVDTLPTPSEPTWLENSPDERFVFVAFAGESLIRIYDRLTTNLVRELEVGGSVVDIDFSADGRRLFALVRGQPGRVVVYGIQDLSDHSGPQVVSVDPWNGRPDASVNSVIGVEFSEPVDRNTLSSEQFVLLPALAKADIEPVHSEVLLSRDNRTGYLIPDEPLNTGWSYTVGVGAGIRDLSGNPLVESFQSSFQVVTEMGSDFGIIASGTSGVLGSPYYVTTLTDGDPVVVSNYYSNALSLHDPTTLIQSFSINREMRTGRALPVGPDQLWVSYPENRELDLIDVTTGNLEDQVTYDLQRADETLSQDRSLLAVATGGNPSELVLAGLRDGKVSRTRTIPIWNWPRALTLSPTGDYAYIAYSNRIVYLNLETEAIERYVSGSEWRELGMLADGKTLYGFEDSNGLVFLDLPTGLRITESPVGTGPWKSALSPGSPLLAIVDQGEDRLLMFDVFTNEVVGTYEPLEGVDLLAVGFSPGGDRLYLTWDAGSIDGMTLFQVEGTRLDLQPSPTPAPLPSPTPPPQDLFDVVTDGKVDSQDLLKLIQNGSMQVWNDDRPNLFLFALRWKREAQK